MLPYGQVLSLFNTPDKLPKEPTLLGNLVGVFGPASLKPRQLKREVEPPQTPRLGTLLVQNDKAQGMVL